jgi:5,10-methylenetetrahydromethanopterin reductase
MAEPVPIRDETWTMEDPAMKFGFCLMSDVTEIGFFSHVEALGYDSVWVADSQMLFSDCYAVLALAARQTNRLRIGPGTAICGTRIAPVQAAAMATINALAPGRVFLGIGTGNTAMRTMGQKPMKMAEYSEYRRVLAGWLRGEPVEDTVNGVTRP